MIIVLLLMLAGVFVGFFISRYPHLIRLNDKLTSVAIYALLFLLGISVGLNKTIIQNLDKIGVQAIVITLGAVSGSVLSLWFLYRLFFQPKKNDGGRNEE